ncbi:MAG TPA: hypothetical protein VIV65_01290 [Gemmatimonadaceae bacterium]
MTARTKYQVGNALLLLGVLVLIVNVIAMLEIIPKYLPPITVNMLVLVLVSIAGTLRRSGRAAMNADKTEAQ